MSDNELNTKVYREKQENIFFLLNFISKFIDNVHLDKRENKEKFHNTTGR